MKVWIFAPKIHLNEFASLRYEISDPFENLYNYQMNCTIFNESPNNNNNNFVICRNASSKDFETWTISEWIAQYLTKVPTTTTATILSLVGPLRASLLAVKNSHAHNETLWVISKRCDATYILWFFDFWLHLLVNSISDCCSATEWASQFCCILELKQLEEVSLLLSGNLMPKRV